MPTFFRDPAQFQVKIELVVIWEHDGIKKVKEGMGIYFRCQSCSYYSYHSASVVKAHCHRRHGTAQNQPAQ